VYVGFEYTPPPPDDCKVFHADGGGLAFLQPNPGWLVPDIVHAAYGNYQFTAKSHIQGVGTDNGLANSDSAELLLVLPWVSEDVCTAFNKLAGTTTGTLNLHWSIKFKDANYGQSAEVTDPAYIGQYEGCNSLLLYAVLIAR